jgi:hypothetical protein
MPLLCSRNPKVHAAALKQVIVEILTIADGWP